MRLLSERDSSDASFRQRDAVVVGSLLDGLAPATHQRYFFDTKLLAAKQLVFAG